MLLTIPQIIMLVASIHGIVLSVISFLRVKKKKGNIHFSFILIYLSAAIIIYLLMQVFTHSKEEYYLYIIHIITVGLCIGPALFFYIISITHQLEIKKYKKIFHYIPALLSLFVVICIHLDLIPESVSYNAHRVLMTIFSVHFFIYCLISGIYIFLFHKRTEGYIIKTKQKYIQWLSFLLIIFNAIFITIVVFAVNSSLGMRSLWEYIWIFLSLFIFIIGYIGFSNPNLLLSNSEIDCIKYKSSSLTEQMAINYCMRLEEHIQKEKPYLDNEITLNKLARQIRISPHHLSRIINEKYYKNFFEYINFLRIQKAKGLLTDKANENINIAEIAFEVGFNSISTFNTAFKKFMHMTPSTYKAKCFP